jgi:prolyl-tRNA synthetase
MGTIAECLSDEHGLVWPENIAPYKVGIVNLKTGQEKTDKACETMYAALNKAGVETFYDDRDESAGVKFADMDLIGLPWHVVVGPRGLEKGLVELKYRKTGERKEFTVEAVLKRITEK